MVQVHLSDVTVLIPQHGQVELTRQCVGQLWQQHPDLGRVLVVDDGSDSAQLRRFHSAGFPATEVLRIPRRRGVTAAWNAGLGQVTTPVVLLLNNDVVSTGAWIQQLIEPLRAPGATVRLAGVAERISREPFDPRISQTTVVKLLEGWCLAGLAETFRELEGFDERFELYFSDTDLQYRLLERWPDGLQVVPGLPVQHLGHQTTQQDASRRQIWQADRNRFVAKWAR